MFTTGTVVGVDATVERGVEQHLVVGLKRFEGALVPTVYEEPNDTAAPAGTNERRSAVRKKAYSVFAALGFRTGFFGLSPTRIYQVFGTGEAAKTLANEPAALANMTKAAKGHRLLPPGGQAAARRAVDLAHTELSGLARDDPVAAEHAEKLKRSVAALGALCMPFVRMQWNPPAPSALGRLKEIEVVSYGSYGPTTNRAHKSVLTYWGNLEGSYRNLVRWQQFVRQGQAGGQTEYRFEHRSGHVEQKRAGDPDEQILLERMERQHAILERLGAAAGTDPDIRAAMDYFLQRTFAR